MDVDQLQQCADAQKRLRRDRCPASLHARDDVHSHAHLARVHARVHVARVRPHGVPHAGEGAFSDAVVD